MTAIQRSGLYFLDQGENSTLSSAALAAYSISDPRLQIWHNRFAHLSEQGIRQLMDIHVHRDKIHSAGLPMQGIRTGPSQTGSTQEGNPKRHKTTRVHPCGHLGAFSHRRLRRRTVLGNIHSFIQFAWISPIKNRSDFLSCPKSLLDTTERPERRCYNSHIDKAGENISAEVQAFCKDHGIALPTTATEQHQQNGIAERLNGIILERLTATLASLNAEIPTKYWPILALSIIYLRTGAPAQ